MAALPTVPDALAYYSPETNFFSSVARSFAETGQIDQEAFYLVLDWKASRARTKHLRRLAGKRGTFKAAVDAIASELHQATTEADRLRILMNYWSFRLPTATAILSVLYPDAFTVYDVRVCKALGDFERLGNSVSWSPKVWSGYQRFRAAVQSATPPGFSLRNRDKLLWGQNKRSDMLKELVSTPKQSIVPS